MNTVVNTGKQVFKYNLSIYYQSTIIYMIVFVLYVVIKGEFVEGSFKLITKDPVIYFFILVIIISIISLIYNLLLNRHIEINQDGIIFRKRNQKREVNIEDILSIKISRKKRDQASSAFKIIRIRAAGRKLPFTIRPYDYENRHELLEQIKLLKYKIENRPHV